MTISTLQEIGSSVDASTTFTQAFGGNVAAGSLVVVCVWANKEATNDPFIDADCTKSAGTATIGTIRLASQDTFDVGATEFPASGVWYAVVTGAGSLTMQVSMSAAIFGGIGIGEYATTVGFIDSAATLEDADVGHSATDDVSAVTTANMDSAGAALFIGTFAATGGIAGTTVTPDSPFVGIVEQEDNSTHQVGAVARAIVSGATTDAVSWVIVASNRGYSAAGAVFKETPLSVSLDVTRGAVLNFLGRTVGITPPTAQVLKPNGDVVVGNWLPNLGGSPYALWPMLDETSPDDTDYIYTIEGSECEVALEAGTDPGVDSSHILRYRLLPMLDAVSITVTLKQRGSGGTVIATRTHNPAPEVATTYQINLSTGEAALITDYANLVVNFVASRV